MAWDKPGRILTVAADRRLPGALARLRAERPDWLVVVRAPAKGRGDTCYYALRSGELEALAIMYQRRESWTVEDALDAEAWAPSAASRRAQRPAPRTGEGGPSAARIVGFDALGGIAAVGAREADALQPNSFSGTDYTWSHTLGLIDVPAQQRLAQLGRAVEVEDGDWVSWVVVRSQQKGQGTSFYALSSDELGHYAAGHASYQSVGRVLEEAELLPSGVVHYGRMITPPTSGSGPAAKRVVLLNSAGRVAAIGKPVQGPAWPAPALPSAVAVAASQPEVVLSAEVAGELGVGAVAKLLYQVELVGEAAPLASSQAASLSSTSTPIVVALLIESDIVEIVRNREFVIQPPTPGVPRTGFFRVKGLRPGVSRLAVTFHQGGTQIGAIGLALEVVRADPGAERARAVARAAPQDAADEDVLLLTIQQTGAEGKVCFEYLLQPASSAWTRRLSSRPLLDRGGGFAASQVAFVERIYEIVTRSLPPVGLPLVQALSELQREVRALGVSLCRELFEPDVAQVLWDLRHRVARIQVASWECYIPWELVRLRNPVTDEIDDRFLCEYGMVRTFPDEILPRTLSMEHWGVLGAKFPSGVLKPAGAELEFFTAKTTDGLRGRGIAAHAIAATRDAFYDALAQGSFDVIHIACHAASSHQSIDDSRLVIGEEYLPGASSSQLIEVGTNIVEAEARLRARRPLIFLNACETGRGGPVLTAWGGWPNVFMRKGAGAFIGCAWEVRDKPAAAFARAFYNALLDGKTLVEAANAARDVAKSFGDASWLAFKVYGHPQARRGLPAGPAGLDASE